MYGAERAPYRNKNGYFYYASTGVLKINGLTGVDPLINDEITQPTVLYVVGADIYIEENRFKK